MASYGKTTEEKVATFKSNRARLASYGQQEREARQAKDEARVKDLQEKQARLRRSLTTAATNLRKSGVYKNTKQGGFKKKYQ